MPVQQFIPEALDFKTTPRNIPEISFKFLNSWLLRRKMQV